MKIYTKTGDKGQTSLFTGKRVAKDDPFIEALGSIDECNSTIGAAMSFLPAIPAMNAIREQLEMIQHALFDVGAAIATPRQSEAVAKLEKTRFDIDAVETLEHWIDRMTEELPPLHAFILPGGHSCGALLHLARSICRRAERRILPLHQRQEVSDNVVMYVNRLSDYLFCVSRYVNFLTLRPEIQWKKMHDAN